MAVDGTVVDEPGELAKIFVMPDVQRQDAKYHERVAGKGYKLAAVPPPEVAQDAQKLIQWEQEEQLLLMKEQAAERKPVSAAELLKEKDERRIVVLGAPGAGKTTLMNYWVVTATAAASVSGSVVESGLATDYFPVLIRIRDLAREPDLSVLEFLTQFMKTELEVASISTAFFDYWLQAGEALILLDGLDEVADDAQRQKVVGKIEAFLGDVFSLSGYYYLSSGGVSRRLL